jgi:hypothetical protein
MGHLRDARSRAYDVLGFERASGLKQPILADAGEGEPAVMPQDGQVPPVLGDIGARVSGRPPEGGHQRIDQRPRAGSS